MSTDTERLMLRNAVLALFHDLGDVDGAAALATALSHKLMPVVDDITRQRSATAKCGPFEPVDVTPHIAELDRAASVLAEAYAPPTIDDLVLRYDPTPAAPPPHDPLPEGALVYFDDVLVGRLGPPVRTTYTDGEELVVSPFESVPLLWQGDQA